MNHNHGNNLLQESFDILIEAIKDIPELAGVCVEAIAKGTHDAATCLLQNIGIPK